MNWSSVTMHDHGTTKEGQRYSMTLTYRDLSESPVSISGVFYHSSHEAINFEIRPDGDLFELLFSWDGHIWQTADWGQAAWALIPEEICLGKSDPIPDGALRPW